MTDREIKDWLWEFTTFDNKGADALRRVDAFPFAENFYPILEAIWAIREGLAEEIGGKK